jgi:uncharacterized protein YjbJ (UPF0337 family)
MSGEFDQAKGRAKQAVGDLTDDDELEREGETDEAAGKVKDAIGKGKERLEEAVDDVRDRPRHVGPASPAAPWSPRATSCPQPHGSSGH